MATIRIHVLPQMEESRARQVVRDLRDCGLLEVTLLTNRQINFKKSICTLTLFLGHRHIMTLKQTLSKVRWIGKASSHSRAQSSLGVNLTYTWSHKWNHMDLEATTSASQIQNDKKYWQSRIKVALQSSRQNWHSEYTIKNFSMYLIVTDVITENCLLFQFWLTGFTILVCLLWQKGNMETWRVFNDKTMTSS